MGKQAYNYKFKELKDIFTLSQNLAQHFPYPDQVMVGIYELLVNAVEHGNLGIGWKLKGELVKQGRWEDEITKRLSMPEYSDKVVEIRVVDDSRGCSLIIKDQGKGFPWRDYINPKDIPQLAHGRGLLIAMNSRFDSITFNSDGSSVKCVARKYG
jgi:anti-sigma regulatory factor (Ser/Thr protein kinase)